MAQPVFSLSRHTRHEVFDAIIRSLNAMPEVSRKVFVMSHYEGLGDRQIADKLNLDPQDVPKMIEEANISFFESVRELRLGPL